MIVARDISAGTFVFWCCVRGFLKGGLLLAGIVALLAWAGKEEK